MRRLRHAVSGHPGGWLLAAGLAGSAWGVVSTDWTQVDPVVPGFGQAVAIGIAGNVYVAGSRSLTGQGLVPSVWKFGPLGYAYWTITPWQTPGDARAVAQRPAGAVDIGGSMLTTPGTGTDAFVARIDQYGATVWVDHFHGPASGDNSVDGIAVTPASQIVVTGKTTTVAGGPDVWIALIDGAGNPLGSYTLLDPSGLNDSGLAVAVDPAGSIYVTGYIGTPGRVRDLWVGKFLPTTPVLTAAPGWPSSFTINTNPSPAATSYGTGIAVAPDGNLVITGVMTSAQGTADIYVAKLANGSTVFADGTILWARTIDGGEQDDDVARAVAVDGSGSIYVTGAVDRMGGGFQDLWIAKFGADGTTLWEISQDGPGHDVDAGFGLTLDPQGLVYATGEITDAFGKQIMLTECLHEYPPPVIGPPPTLSFRTAPNPYRPGSGGAQDAAGIQFAPVPALSTLRIYTLTGSLVTELKDTDGDGIIVWNAKTPGGTNVASGVYLYQVSPPAGAAFRGKVVIIR